MMDLADWDEDTLKKGSRYSVIYGFCGITFLMIGFANLCLTIGAYNFQARALGLCFMCCLGCINFAALITTACFRFNTMGKLASLNLAYSKYGGTGPNGEMLLTNDRTYADDASLITALWVTQLIVCVCNCCLSGIFNKPPSVEELARMNAAFEGTNPNQLSDHQGLMHETQPMNHDAAPAPQQQYQ
jgi:hypothetical protein